MLSSKGNMYRGLQLYYDFYLLGMHIVYRHIPTERWFCQVLCWQRKPVAPRYFTESLMMIWFRSYHVTVQWESWQWHHSSQTRKTNKLAWARLESIVLHTLGGNSNVLPLTECHQPLHTLHVQCHVHLWKYDTHVALCLHMGPTHTTGQH